MVGHQHEDISDHRFEQRGLLHVQVEVQNRKVHAIVVHLGLIPAAASARCSACSNSSSARCPRRARGGGRRFQRLGPQLKRMLGVWPVGMGGARTFTYPGRLPLAQLDHARAGPHAVSCRCPRRIWWRMSDHLPLIAEFRL